MSQCHLWGHLLPRFDVVARARQKPGRGDSANNNKRNCEREKRGGGGQNLIWMCLVTETQLFKAHLIRTENGKGQVEYDGFDMVVWRKMEAMVQILWYSSQHVLISPPRVFVISHLFTVNAICELLRCFAVQWRWRGTMGPFPHHYWDWESLGAVDKHESDSAGHDNRLQYLAQHTLGFILGGIQLSRGGGGRSNGHILQRVCPSKAWVKPAVAPNDCWFTGVWIWHLLAWHAFHCCPDTVATNVALM